MGGRSHFGITGGGVFGKATVLSSSVVRLGASGWLCLIRDYYQCFGMIHRPTLGRSWWLGGGWGWGGAEGGASWGQRGREGRSQFGLTRNKIFGKASGASKLL